MKYNYKSRTMINQFFKIHFLIFILIIQLCIQFSYYIVIKLINFFYKMMFNSFYAIHLLQNDSNF